MTCKDCEKVQDIVFNKNIPRTSPIAYYRIDVANIAIVGCKKHIKMAIDKLNSSPSDNNDFKKPCPKCNGLGYDEESANDDGEVEECSICKGTGRAS